MWCNIKVIIYRFLLHLNKLGVCGGWGLFAATGTSGDTAKSNSPPLFLSIILNDPILFTFSDDSFEKAEVGEGEFIPTLLTECLTHCNCIIKLFTVVLSHICIIIIIGAS